MTLPAPSRLARPLALALLLALLLAGRTWAKPQFGLQYGHSSHSSSYETGSSYNSGLGLGAGGFGLGGYGGYGGGLGLGGGFNSGYGFGLGGPQAAGYYRHRLSASSASGYSGLLGRRRRALKAADF